MEHIYFINKMEFLKNKYSYLLVNPLSSRKTAFDCLIYLNEIDKISDELSEYLNQPIIIWTPTIVQIVKDKNFEFDTIIEKISDLLAYCIVDINVYDSYNYLIDFKIIELLANDFVLIKHPSTQENIKIKTHLYLACLIRFPVELISKKLFEFREDCHSKIFFKENLDYLEKMFSSYINTVKIMLNIQVLIGQRAQIIVNDIETVQKLISQEGNTDINDLYKLVKSEMNFYTFNSIYKYEPAKLFYIVNEMILHFRFFDFLYCNMVNSVVSFHYTQERNLKRKMRVSADGKSTIFPELEDIYDRIVLINSNEFYVFFPKIFKDSNDVSGKDILIS